jgi:hypothetical protein
VLLKHVLLKHVLLKHVLLKHVLLKHVSALNFLFMPADKLLTVYITKCNGQRIRLYIREGILCGVGGNLCKR